MKKTMQRHKRLSVISLVHYIKLGFRSFLFLLVLGIYLVSRIGWGIHTFQHVSWVIAIIWLIFVIEMIFRFFPSKVESMGCQKQFQRNYRATGEELQPLNTWRSTAMVAVAWFLLNGVIAVLYFVGVIDQSILILISLAYSVCDMICILFFCPFQTWFMKNKCCTGCRIYNWDYAMMFTPLLLIPHPITWSLLGCSLILLIRWEVTVRRHPERFSEKTNACLSCTNCREKLCQHKKQLKKFIWKNRNRWKKMK